MRPNPLNNYRLFVGRIRTEETETAMSITEGGSSRNTGVKTLGIRLEPDIHAQLSLIAQLRGSNITDEIRRAIEAHITAVKAQTDLAAQADSVLADIEREATARKDAITALFGTPTAPQTTESKPGPKATTKASREGEK